MRLAEQARRQGVESLHVALAVDPEAPHRNAVDLLDGLGIGICPRAIRTGAGGPYLNLVSTSPQPFGDAAAKRFGAAHDVRTVALHDGGDAHGRYDASRVR